MGRRTGVDKKQLVILVRTDLLTELFLLHPDLQRPDGHTKYGAISSYFDELIRKDLEERKRQLVEPASP